MSALQWMDIIYPANSSLFAGYVLMKILYMLIVRRGLALVSRRMLMIIQFVIISDVSIGIAEIGVHYILNKLTGNDAKLNIDEYRYYVVIVRGAMAACLVLSIVSQLMAILEFITAGQWSRIKFWRLHGRDANW